MGTTPAMRKISPLLLLAFAMGCSPGTVSSTSSAPVDGDADGYTSDVDCDDHNATIYPGATEVCDDGIDQDCSGADLPCAACAEGAVAGRCECGAAAQTSGYCCANVWQAGACTHAATVTLWADATSIASGASTSVHWSSTHSTGCVSSGGGGSAATGSFTTPALFAATTYTVSCAGTDASSTSEAVTIYIGSGCMTTQTGAPGAIALANVPSRLSGVAPLSVFFDATGSTAAATTRPFHDLEYRWDFGDRTGAVPNLSPPLVGTSTWNMGSKPGVSSRNSASGPVTVHVYETPGMYFVSLSVTDGTNTASNSCTQIVVQDPDVVFASTNTICVGATSLPVAGVDGCPVDAATALQPSFAAAISSYVGTGKRVLFKRGDTFTAASTPSISSNGPGIVGAYGAGTLPIINATANVDILDISSSTTPTTVNDWRIMDLELNGNSGSGVAGVNALGSATRITILRLNIHDAGYGIEFSHYVLDYWNNNGHPGHTMWEQVYLIDNTLSRFSNIGIYAGAGYFAIAGNSIDTSPYQIVRLPQIYYGVVSNNTIVGGGAGYSTLRIDGPAWCTSEPQGPTACNYTNDSMPTNITGAHGGYTDLVEVADNLVAAASDVYIPVDIAPSNGNWDSRIRNLIFERNFVSGAVAGVHVSARDITARYNIISLVGGGYHGIGIQTRNSPLIGAEPPPLRVAAYSNTFYATGDLTGVNIDTFATDSIVMNNLAFAPNGGSTIMIADAGSTNLTASNNSSDAQIKSTSPLFENATGTMSVPGDFRPTGPSYAIGTGAVVPAWSDFFWVPQTISRDMGAVSH